MLANDVLSILESDNVPQRLRCIAHALFIAMLALERYGHSMSYAHDGDGRSEADHDGGLIARRALEDIRAMERRLH